MPLSESSVEQNLIDLLVSQGYEYLYGPDISPYGASPLRKGFETVILETHFENSLERLNPESSPSARKEVLQLVHRLTTGDMMTNNESFHTMMTDGVTIEVFQNG